MSEKPVGCVIAIDQALARIDDLHQDAVALGPGYGYAAVCQTEM